MSGGSGDGVPVSGLQLTDADKEHLEWTRWHWGRVLYQDHWPFG